LSGLDEPLVIYLDLDDLDPTPGMEVLRRAGFRVLQTVRDELGRFPEAIVLMVGYDLIDASVLDVLPELKVIATHSAGVDMVDLEAARRCGIWVCNLPDAATEEVAVHTLALTLSLVRGVTCNDRIVRLGGWSPERPETLRRPSSLTCGVVGLGRIGRRFVGLAEPIFARVVGADPGLDPSMWPAGVEQLSIEELLGVSDIVSLHLPLTPETKGMINDHLLSLLPEGAFLVNASRGALVDESALAAALDSGRLAGAALDVLCEEPPPPGSVLPHHERTVVTPHIGYLSVESRLDYVLRPVANVLAWHRSGTPLNVIVEGKGPAVDKSVLHVG